MLGGEMKTRVLSSEKVTLIADAYEVPFEQKEPPEAPKYRRAYCWRIGRTLRLDEGERCPECGSRDHDVVPVDECGAFAPCGSENHDGHHCALFPGHEGKHWTDSCEEK